MVDFVSSPQENGRTYSRKVFGNSDVLAGLPYDDAVLMLTRNQGGFLLYRDGRVEKWKPNVMIYSGSIPLIVR